MLTAPSNPACVPPDAITDADHAKDHNAVRGRAPPSSLCSGNGPVANFAEWAANVDAIPDPTLRANMQARLLDALDSPSCAILDQTVRTTFLRNVRAPLPLSLPFAGTDATLGGGWLYKEGSTHRALDFSSPNGSFSVRAVADGVVIGVYFDAPPSAGGNTVVIEHTGQNGKKIYSFYMHLRNGLSNDRAAVTNMKCSTSYCALYKLAAGKNPPAAFWGTDAHVIPVTFGSVVKRGQLIGYAGNTMTASLDANGDPTDVNANTHLHFAVGVPLPNDPKVVVAVDPYGVYHVNDTNNCYTDILKKTHFPRLFAPYLPDFHGVSWDVWSSYGEYMNGMNYLPATLSGYHVNGAFFLTGSYRYASSMSHYNWIGTAPSTMAQYVGDNRPWVPRETRARIGSDGYADFDTIVLPRPAGESTAFWYRLNQSELNSKLTTYVNQQGYSIGDFAAYREFGTQYYSILFTKDPSRANWFSYGRSKSQVLADISGMPSHLRVAAVTIDETTYAYSMVTRQKQGRCSVRFVDEPMSWYASNLEQQQNAGRVLESVQVFANGSRFNAVFSYACP